MPHRGIRGDVVREQIDALLRMKIDHFDAILSQPIDATAEIHGLADDQHADAELPHQPAAIPAGGQRGHHDFVPITALPPGLAKRIRFAVHGRIIFLNPAIVPSA